MARKGILYEQVAAAIETLQAKGRKITVRAIHAVTGGSMSTVLKHYRRWQSERLGHRDDVPDISPQLTQALREELQNYARRALLSMEARLKRYVQRLKEAESCRDRALEKITLLESTRHQSREYSKTETDALRKQLHKALQGKDNLLSKLHESQERRILAEQRLAETEARVTSLLQTLEETRERLRQTESDAGRLEIEVEKANERTLCAEMELRKSTFREKPVPQKPPASPGNPSPSQPATDEQQGAFDF
jgi:chromosome segregation ATPase